MYSLPHTSVLKYLGHEHTASPQKIIYIMWKEVADMNDRDMQDTHKKKKKVRKPYPLDLVITEIQAQKYCSKQEVMLCQHQDSNSYRQSLYIINTTVASNQHFDNAQCVLCDHKWQKAISKEGETKGAAYQPDAWCKQ